MTTSRASSRACPVSALGSSPASGKPTSKGSSRSTAGGAMDRNVRIEVGSILKAGRHMGRDRYQEGSLVLSGKRIKRWRGHFYVYRKHEDGREVRHFRNVFLGFKSEMDKGEAKAALRELIARETRNVAPAPLSVTLRWFYDNRYLPQKEEQWKITSR